MSVSLEDIQNLSVEVQALVKAGLPLESNLADAGMGHGNRLQELTKSISARLSNGESLDDTIRQNQIGAPRMLSAAIAAGIKTGRLAESIEMLGDMANDLVDLRRRIMQSITYPLTVVAMAILLFCLFIRGFLIRVDALLNDPIPNGAHSVLQNLIHWDARYWWWPFILPVIGALCLGVWVFSGRASSMAFRGPERLLFVLPGVSGMIRDLQFYNLARMLSLMIDRQLPLSESLQLAGACSGSRALDFACQSSAAEIEQGNVAQSYRNSNWKPGMLPPQFLACLRNSSLTEGQFQMRLRSASAYYRRRLSVSILWLRNIVPIAMFVIIGGGSVALYAMTVFWPVAEIYRHIVPN